MLGLCNGKVFEILLHKNFQLTANDDTEVHCNCLSNINICDRTDSGISREFGTYLRYIKTLKFADKPDYNYLKNLFRNSLSINRWMEDNVFDWMILSSDQPTPSSTTTVNPSPTDNKTDVVKTEQLINQISLKDKKVDPRIVIEEEEAVNGICHNNNQVSPRNSTGNNESIQQIGMYVSPSVSPSVTVSEFEDVQVTYDNTKQKGVRKRLK